MRTIQEYITDYIDQWAGSQPDQQAFVFLEDGEDKRLVLTYGQLRDRARTVAARLAAQLEGQSRVVLFFNQGLDFIIAFYGCLYAGMIAVPSVPPKSRRSADRVGAIAEDCQADLILTHAALAASPAIAEIARRTRARVHTLEDLLAAGPASYPGPSLPRPADQRGNIAFLQYTSGSTGTPKGVVVTHQNVLHNQQVMQSTFGQRKEGIIASWLPFYHDMGLVGKIIHPVYLGTTCIMMSPLHFIQKPVRWLLAISRYGVHTSGGPNFAYELCADAVTNMQMEGVDLSSWKVAFNGAEPVRAETLSRFARRFARYGFAENAFMPCYGAAETTLLVCGQKLESKPIIGHFPVEHLQYYPAGAGTADPFEQAAFVSCGEPAFYTARIVNHAGRPVADGRVGEIWLSGKSIAAGYWQKGPESEATFKALLPGETEPFFRTGDLGIIQDGKLYVTGRLKDLIIINGKNHYPQDVEAQVTGCHPDLLADGCAAFSVTVEGREKLVVVAEVFNGSTLDPGAVFAAIREVVFDHFDVYTGQIVLVRRGTVPRTTSGKIQRAACKTQLLDGKLPVIAEWSAGQVAEGGEKLPSAHPCLVARLSDLLREQFEMNVLDERENLLRYGLDSIKATRMVLEINNLFAVDLGLDALYRFPCLSRLAAQISLRKNARVAAPVLAEVKEYYSLSNSQRNIWFHQALHPGTNAYHIPVSVRLPAGAGSLERLDAAVRRVLARFEVLHTVFPVVAGTPVQRIKKICDLPLRECPAGEPQVEAYTGDFIRQRFDLAEGPLFRLLLVRTAGECRLLLVFHHLVADGFSIQLFLKELLHCLPLAGEAAPGPPAPWQYKDYAEWEKKQPRHQEAGFDQYLAGLRDNGFRRWLPFDALPEQTTSRRGASRLLPLHPALPGRLNALAGDNGTSLSMVLLSAYFVLLHQLSGQRRIVVGMPVLNRPRKEFWNTPGVFLNCLMLSVEVDPEGTFGELVSAVKKEYFRAGQFRNVTFSEVVKELGMAENQLHFPVSGVFFNSLNFIEAENTRDHSGSFLDNGGLDVNFDLNCYLSGDGNALQLRLDYRQALFLEATIDQFAGKLTVILDQVCGRSGIPLWSIGRRTDDTAPAEAATRPQPVIAGNLVDAFYRRVEQYASRPAVVTPALTLTYAELNERTNQWSRCLIEKIGAYRRVAYCLPHDHHVTLVVLAILKAGGMYIPLDPQAPAERVRRVMANVQPDAVIVNDETYEMVLAAGPLPMIHLRELFAGTAGTDNVCLLIPPEAPAYLLHTSGSTGLPKGVIQRHCHVLHFAGRYAEALAISPQDHLSGFSPSTYDSFVNDFFGAILQGAAYFPLSLLDKVTGEQVLGWLKENKISVWHVVPTVFRAFAASWAANGCRLNDLRIVKMTGEVVWRQNFELFCAITGKQARFCVSLGSTESTLSAINLFGHDYAGRKPVMPVGYPVAQTQVLICDEHLREKGALEPGEIVVLSPYLAPGYLNDPAQTHCAFGQFASQPSYRTGDLGRRLGDGRIEWLGRKDNQVKINGVRIEPAEIEAQMHSVKGIRQAAVVWNSTGAGPGVLVAYYTADGPLSATEIRQALRHRLPPAMIPAHYIALGQLPLSGNGKLNRAALPDPAVRLPAAGWHANEVEETIAAIWAEVLQVAVGTLGPDSSFFEAGGNSLLASVALARIERVLNASIDLSAFFANPTPAGVARLVTQGQGKALPAFEPPAETEQTPLTDQQQRLFVFQHLAPGSVAYNMTLVLRLSGELDTERVAAAVGQLVERHQMLRAQFAMKDGALVQSVLRGVSYTLEVEESREDIVRIAQAFVRPFRLEEAPLARTKLVCAGDGLYWLLFDVHHIVCDGLSMNILARDFVSLYCQQVLDPVNLQYAHFVQALQVQRKQESWLAHRRYWLNQLSGSQAALELPHDFPKPAVKSFAGKRVGFELDEHTTRVLTALARQEEATVYQVLLSAFLILLARLSGEEDVSICSPVSGRTDGRVHGTVGMFVNTLVLRNQVDGGLSFRDFLKQVKQNFLQAYDHQHFTYESLAEELADDPAAAKPPLPAVMFAFQNYPFQPLNLPGLTVEQYEWKNDIARFDLTLEGRPLDQKIVFAFEYATDLFRHSTIVRYQACFLTILRAIIRDREIPLDAINVLSPREEDQVVRGFNCTAAPFPADQSITGLFKAQARRTPGAVALIVGGHATSYQAFDELTDALAGYLRSRGVRANTVTALVTARSREMMIGIFAILKAGGVYLPIDPGYPKRRIEYYLKDSNAQCLLVPNGEDVHFHFDGEMISIAGFLENPGDTVPVTDQPAPGQYAYLLYTSGTTGTPKGVLINHRALVNRIWWMQRAFPLGAADRLIQKTPLSFDVSLWEVCWWSVSGAALVVPEPGVEKDPAQLMDCIARQGVTVIHFVPSMLAAFLEFAAARPGSAAQLTGLRTVFTSGEALLPSHVHSFYQLLADQAHPDLVNLYGPTEAAIDVTYHAVSRSGEAGGTIPIGKPIDNISMLVLDGHLRPQPVGVNGDLYIAGVGLSDGYLNRPELTREKFLDTPLMGGKKIYKTGDVARWTDEGSLLFTGRSDFQMKLNGRRVEPGEIESALMQSGLVSQAAVVSGEGDRKDSFLGAYISPKKGLEAAGDLVPRLKLFLAGQLPDYMIPRQFRVVEQIPLTGSGKLDKKNLPGFVTEARTEAAEAPVPGSVEELLVKIWQEVLRQDDVGVHSNYFQLGGDSIKSIKIVAKMLQLGYEVGVKDLMLHPTIDRLSLYVRNAQPRDTGIQAQGEVPLTPVQSLFFRKVRTQRHHFNQALLLALTSVYTTAQIRRAAEALSQHHDTLRFTFKQTPGGVTQQCVPYLVPGVEEVDVSGADDPPAALLAGAQARQAVLDLENGPLVALTLFHLPGCDYLLFTMHHLLVDAVSWQVLLADLDQLLQWVNVGPAPRLGPRPDSYGRWSRALRTLARSAVMRQEMAYWRGVMQAIPAPTAEPGAAAGPLAERVRYTRRFAEPDVRRLGDALSEKYGIRLNEAILGVLLLALGETFNLAQVAVAIEGHGRGHELDGVNVARTVGWFTTIFPFVSAISPTPSLLDYLVAVKEQFREIPNQGLGYGLLSEFSGGGDGKTGPAPYPDILFNFLGNLDELSGFSQFSVAKHHVGQLRGKHQEPWFALEVESYQQEGQLVFNVSGNRQQYSDTHVNRLLDLIGQKLAAAGVLARQQSNRVYSPSDFGNHELTMDDLESIFE